MGAVTKRKGNHQVVGACLITPNYTHVFKYITKLCKLQNNLKIFSFFVTFLNELRLYIYKQFNFKEYGSV